MSARRREQEPLVRPTTAFFLGLVVAVIGLLAGIGDRARYPAESVRELPTEEDRIEGRVYYVPGSERMSASPADIERRFVANDSPLRLLEGDVNGWTRQTLPFPQRQQGDEKAYLSILPGPPNFRFDTDFAQVVIPLQARLFGTDYDVALITSGKFGRSGDGAAFKPVSASLGSAPIPPFMVSIVAAFAKKIYRDADGMAELERAWSGYHSVQASEGAVTLERSH